MVDEIKINGIKEKSDSNIYYGIYKNTDRKINSQSHSDEESQQANNFVNFNIATFLLAVGDSIELFRPIDNQYCNGTVAKFSDNTVFTINYDDGNIEELSQMSKENWQFSSSAMLHEMSTKYSIVSNEKEFLNQLLDYFGNKPFLCSRAQKFPSFNLLHAYNS